MCKKVGQKRLETVEDKTVEAQRKEESKQGKALQSRLRTKVND